MTTRTLDQPYFFNLKKISLTDTRMARWRKQVIFLLMGIEVRIPIWHNYISHFFRV